MTDKTIKGIEKEIEFAREALNENDIPRALNWSDNAIRDIVLLELSDTALIERLIRANPTKNQALTIDAMIILGTTFSKKALQLKQLNRGIDYQLVREAFIAAESYFWIAAKYQIDAGDIVSLTATTIGICDLHYKKGNYDSGTSTLLEYNDLVISQMTQSGKFNEKTIEHLRAMNEKVVQKLFGRSHKR